MKLIKLFKKVLYNVQTKSVMKINFNKAKI